MVPSRQSTMKQIDEILRHDNHYFAIYESIYGQSIMEKIENPRIWRLLYGFDGERLKDKMEL